MADSPRSIPSDRESVRAAVRAALWPTSVAVVGASSDEGKFGGRLVRNLVDHGYAGVLVPVHRRSSEVLGLQAYESVQSASEALGRSIDVVVAAVPASASLAVAEDCVRAGARSCVLIATGFGEAGAEGVALDRRLREIIGSGDTHFIGPNCLGLFNTHCNLALTSSMSLRANPLRRGGIAIASQSGALMVSLYDDTLARHPSAGFSTCASLGNQVDITIDDILDAVADDAETRVVCCYVEGIRDGGWFLETVSRCVEAGKEVFITKAGRTEGGRVAVRSHTASLAGSYEVFRSMVTAAGGVLFDDPTAMMAAATLTERWPKVSGRSASLVGSSGGVLAVGLDQLASSNVAIAAGSPETVAALRELIPGIESAGSIDLGARRPDADPVDAAREVVSLLANDTGVGVLIPVATSTPRGTEVGLAMVDTVERADIPVVPVMVGGKAGAELAVAWDQVGVPWFRSIRDAVDALAVTLCRPSPDTVPGRGAMDRGDAAVEAVGRLGDSSDERRRLGAGHTPAPKVKDLLASYGIPVNRSLVLFAGAADREALLAGLDLRWPVAVKLIAEEVVHKADVGGVILNIGSPPEVVEAVRQLAERAETLGLAVPRIVVEEMVRGVAEVLVGVRMDETFGMVLAVGSGGSWAEAIADVRILPGDASLVAIERALRELEVFRRGPWARAAGDLSALIDLVGRVAQVGSDLGDRLGDLEINPVIVQEDGSCSCVDARAWLTR